MNQVAFGYPTSQKVLKHLLYHRYCRGVQFPNSVSRQTTQAMSAVSSRRSLLYRSSKFHLVRFEMLQNSWPIADIQSQSPPNTANFVFRWTTMNLRSPTVMITSLQGETTTIKQISTFLGYHQHNRPLLRWNLYISFEKTLYKRWRHRQAEWCARRHRTVSKTWRQNRKAYIHQLNASAPRQHKAATWRATLARLQCQRMA